VRALRAGERSAARTALARVLALRPDDALAAIWGRRLEDPAFDGGFRLDGK
jgi:hypothetical protein